MGDMADIFALQNNEKKKRRLRNRITAIKVLLDNKIKFESKNYDHHLIINASTGKIDFWPSTGRWIARKKDGKGFGIKSLIKFMVVPNSNS